MSYSFGPGGISPAIKILILSNIAVFVLSWRRSLMPVNTKKPPNRYIIQENRCSNALPATMKSARITLKGSGFSDVAGELAWLGAILVILVTLASLRFRKKLV